MTKELLEFVARHKTWAEARRAAVKKLRRDAKRRRALRAQRAGVATNGNMGR